MCALPSVKKGKSSSYHLHAKYGAECTSEHSYWHRFEIGFWKFTIHLLEFVQRWMYEFSTLNRSGQWTNVFSYGFFLSAVSGLIIGLLMGIVKNFGY